LKLYTHFREQSKLPQLKKKTKKEYPAIDGGGSNAAQIPTIFGISQAELTV
jgi:hypothetical protein